MKKTKDAGLPEFRTLEEERDYWEARGPLAAERKGRANRPKPGQKRSAILAVRLTGEELTRLRDMAAKQGLGPSTFARLLLTSAIERSGQLPKHVTADELKEAIERKLPQPVRDRLEELAEDIAIGSSENPIILIDPSQKEMALEVTWLFLKAVLSLVGVNLVMPGEKEFQVRRVAQVTVKAKPQGIAKKL